MAGPEQMSRDNIEIRSCFAAPVMYAPKLSFALPGCQSMGASELVRPRAGLMLFFPSWLAHSVRPYLGEGTRISIAFNLSI